MTTCCPKHKPFGHSWRRKSIIEVFLPYCVINNIVSPLFGCLSDKQPFECFGHNFSEVSCRGRKHPIKREKYAYPILPFVGSSFHCMCIFASQLECITTVGNLSYKPKLWSTWIRDEAYSLNQTSLIRRCQWKRFPNSKGTYVRTKQLKLNPWCLNTLIPSL